MEKTGWEVLEASCSERNGGLLVRGINHETTSEIDRQFAWHIGPDWVEKTASRLADHHPIVRWILDRKGPGPWMPSAGDKHFTARALAFGVHELGHSWSIGGTELDFIFGDPLAKHLETLFVGRPEEQWENELLARVSQYLVMSQPATIQWMRDNELSEKAIATGTLEFYVKSAVSVAERVNQYVDLRGAKFAGYGKVYFEPIAQSLDHARELTKSRFAQDMVARIMVLKP